MTRRTSDTGLVAPCTFWSPTASGGACAGRGRAWPQESWGRFLPLGPEAGRSRLQDSLLAAAEAPEGAGRRRAAFPAGGLRAGLAESPPPRGGLARVTPPRAQELGDRKPQGPITALLAPGFSWSIQLISVCRFDSLHSALAQEVAFQREEMRYSGRTCCHRGAGRHRIKSMPGTKRVLGDFGRRLSGCPTTSSSTSLSMPLSCVHHWQLPSLLPDAAPHPPFKCKLCERVGSPPDSLVQPQDLEQWPSHPKSWIQWKNATLHLVNATLVLFLCPPKYIPFFGICMALLTCVYLLPPILQHWVSHLSFSDQTKVSHLPSICTCCSLYGTHSPTRNYLYLKHRPGLTSFKSQRP